MAGDWIKMRRGLRHDPKVIAMARYLSTDRVFMNWWSDPVRKTCNESVTEIVTFQNVTRVTVCALLDVWSALNNSLGEDSTAPFMSLTDLDDIAEVPAIGEAMEAVGWVEVDPAGGLVFPNFSEHNTPSKSRKSAMTNAERQQRYRDKKKVEKEGVTRVTESNGREEKRRIYKTKAKEIQNVWNTFAEQHDFAKVIKFTDKRISHLKARIEEDEKRESVSWWQDLFQFASEQEGLRGATWFDLDWILKSENNLTKLREGKYANAFH